MGLLLSAGLHAPSDLHFGLYGAVVTWVVVVAAAADSSQMAATHEYVRNPIKRLNYQHLSA
jgi:hypothetical protein